MAFPVSLRVAIALDRHPQPRAVAVIRATFFAPVEKLRGRVCLVVMLAVGEHGQLVEVFGEPRSVLGEMDKAVLDHRGLCVQTHGFVEGRLIPGGGIAALGDQLLDQLRAGRLVLD